MKLRVLAKPTLTLTKERKVLNYGAEFEVDEARAKEILAVTFENKPVAEIVEEPIETSVEEPTTEEPVVPVKQTKKANSKK